MPLLVPKLIGPISAVSSVVRVQNHLPGAKIEIVATRNGTPHVLANSGASAPGDGLVALVPKSLLPGDVLHAVQHVGAETSGLPADTDSLQVLDGPTPQDAGPVAIVSHPYACGGCLYVEGAFPGATVRIYDGAQTRGSMEAIGTFARLGVVPAIDSKPLAVSQRVGPYFGPAVPLGEPDPPPSVAGGRGKFKPPAPRIVGPVEACAPFVGVDRVVDGATVELEHRRSQPSFPKLPVVSDVRCVDLDEVSWPVPNLGPKDVLRARQTLCGSTSDWCADVPVGPLGGVPTPWIATPCSGDSALLVGNLTVGAEVTLEVDGVAYRGIAAREVDALTVPVGTIAYGKKARVRQTLCGHPSPWSAEVTVRNGAQPPLPTIPGPLHACATRVRVKNVPPGASVEVVSYQRSSATNKGIISPKVYALGPEPWVDVPVIALQRADVIFALVRRCGQETLSDPGTWVFSTSDVGMPIVNPVATCGPIVVRNVVPGALVELYVDGVFAPPAKHAFATQVAFPVPEAMRDGAWVRARQRACSRVSPLSQAVQAKPGQLTVVAGSQKRIAQLTGEEDDDEGQSNFIPHPNKTQSEHGLPGIDLGVPLEHDGRLYLLFGDSSQKKWTGSSWVPAAPPLIKPIAVVEEAPELPDDGLRLRFLSDPQNPMALHELRLDGEPALSGSYEVPTGAFSYDGRVHVFVMRRASSDDSTKNAFPGLDDGGGGAIGGRVLMASAPNLDVPLAPAVVLDVNGFSAPGLSAALREWKLVNFSARVVDLGAYPALEATGDGLFVWSSGVYRRSDLYFAWTRLTKGSPIPPPSQWQFFTGLDASGTPSFGALADAIGLLEWSDTGARNPVMRSSGPLDDTSSDIPYRLGEFSVSYVSALRSWLLLFGHNDKNAVRARTARMPWGPWTPTTLVAGQIRGRRAGCEHPAREGRAPVDLRELRSRALLLDERRDRHRCDLLPRVVPDGGRPLLAGAEGGPRSGPSVPRGGTMRFLVRPGAHALCAFALSLASCAGTNVTNGSMVASPSGTIRLARGMVLRSDGVVVCGGARGALGVSTTRFRDLKGALGNPLAIGTDGAAYRMLCRDGVIAQVVTPSPVADIVGGGKVRRPDGSVWEFDTEVTSLRGATSCGFNLCTIDGRLVLAPVPWPRSTLTQNPFPGSRVLQVDATPLASEGADTILDDSGNAYRATVDVPASRMSFTRIEGLPPIRRVDGNVYWDAADRAWYEGPVWVDDERSGVSGSSPGVGLPTSFLDGPVRVTACPPYWSFPKSVYACVAATRAPRLDGAEAVRPGPAWHDLATYVLRRDGSVHCWGPTDGEGQCLRFY